MTSRFNLCHKLAIGSSVMLLLVLVLSYSSLAVIQRLGGSFDQTLRETTQAADYFGDIQAGFQEMKAYAKSTQFAWVANRLLKVEAGQQKVAGAIAECSACHSIAAPESSRQALHEISSRVLERVNRLRLILDSANARQALDGVDQGVRQWEELFAEYLRYTSQDQFESAHGVITDRMGPVLEAIQGALQRVEKEQKLQLETTGRRNSASVAGSRWITLLLILLSVGAGGGIFVLIGHVGRTLRKLVAELGDKARSVANFASAVFQTSQALASGATEQAAALEQSAASSEEVNAAAQQNASHSAKVAAVTENVTRQMEEMNRLLEGLNTTMDGINSSSGQISKIIRLIDEIAFQTNVLALNAAVEAARAGEAGKGFSVVADEVRNLAQRCAQAARDTTGLIEESVNRSREGKVRLDGVREQVRLVVEGIGGIYALAEEVRSGSNEQARAMEQISSAVCQMQQLNQRTEAGAEQSATAGAQLHQESSDLDRMVTSLVGLVGGSEPRRG